MPQESVNLVVSTEQERQRAEATAERLAQRLRDLGLDPGI